MASPARTGLRKAIASTSKQSPIRLSRRAISRTIQRPETQYAVQHRPWRRIPHEGRARWHSTAPAEPTAPSIVPEILREDTYDIVIIGAGNAGLALACTLLSKPAVMRDDTRILLVEGGSLDRVRSWTGHGEWENRVSSLTAENVQFLKDIGAWEYIEESRSCPISDIIVWTSSTASSSSQIHFPQPAGSADPMARMTENTNLQRAFLRKIEHDGRGRVVIAERSKVEEMRMDEGGRSVALRCGGDRWVRGGVVVGADGYNSPVRAFSQIESFGHAYDTHAVVATLRHSAIDNRTAFQRFLPSGPIAFLPLGRDATTMVWSTSPALASAYKALGAERLTTMVNLGFFMDEPGLAEVNAQVLAAQERGTTVDASTLDAKWNDVLMSLTAEQAKSLPPPIASISPTSIASFPLKLSHAESYIGDRTVLVGDAAHTVHPLAGQGLNMGLADVKVLGEVWESVRQQGGDLGAYTSLLPYTRERYPANHLLLSATDKLHYLFGTRIPLVSWVRSVGMDIINEVGPLKQIFMGRVGASASGTSTSTTDGPARRNGKSAYERVADGMDGWRNARMVAGMAASAGGEIVKGGARQLLERLAK
ncbi:hypothetical protein NliqN6_1299 [Naganishia liquefaciens]|uniref:Ubiquinone biosynthesis monooxygenase COQ6, mitochondrial n=1 Tax=Naganishia liquefaciens TaxID=104408 RepID=A0A8H3YE48_9TREE|nr:hypothetical protein NliqN6_1299 [Naganishia liquefaciens]